MGPAETNLLRLVGCPCDDVILQDSAEISRYLQWLKEFKVRRYLEIGSWTGRLVNHLHQELELDLVAACDLGWAEEAGLAYHFDPDVRFLKASSWSQEYKDWAQDLGTLDVIFIDGDHTYEGVRRDFEINRRTPHRFLAFHDVCNPKLGAGSRQLWGELEGYKYEIFSPSSDTGIGIWSATEDPTPSELRGPSQEP